MDATLEVSSLSATASQYGTMDVYVAVFNKLQELTQKFPDRFIKPTHLLPTVHARNQENEWKDRLLQAQQQCSGSRFALIPYYNNGSHWIGIVLDFDTSGELESAHYMDPLKPSDFQAQMLEQILVASFPHRSLQPRQCQTDKNVQKSPLLTAVNLLNAVQHTQDKRGSSTMDKQNFQGKSSIDFSNQRATSNTSRSSFSVPISEDHDRSTCQQLEQDSATQMQSLTIRETLELPQRTGTLEESIREPYEEIRLEEAKTTGQVLLGCKRLTALDDPVTSLSSASSSIHGQNDDQEQLEKLRENLQKRLDKLKIADESKLNERIQRVHIRIKEYDDEGREEEANKERKFLADLKEVQRIVDRVRLLENEMPTENCEIHQLEGLLTDGLKKLKVTDVGKLPDMIQRSEKRILEYRDEEQEEMTAREAERLRQLKELVSLQDKIEKLKSPVSLSGHLKNNQRAVSSRTETSIPQLPSAVTDYAEQKYHSITAETLNDMHEDFHSSTISAEKHLLGLRFFTSLKQAPVSVLASCRFDVPSDIEKEMIGELSSLKERLKAEELETEEIHNRLNSCEIHMRNQNWQTALTELRILYKHISPLDMRELRRLVKQVDDAGKLIKDKDIILLIGGTGTGKSTTIHFLGGSKMIKTTFDGMSHIAPTEIKNSDLKRVLTAPSATSITRFITPITINPEDIGDSTTSSIILCDSPGFEDTNGAEVDTANGVGIVRAISECHSVKPVVLVSYKSMGDRCAGIKDLVHTLTGLISGMKDHIESFVYLFTKFPQDEKNTIHGTLGNIMKYLSDEEKSESCFTCLLRDMINKTRKGPIVIDPITDDPLNTIQYLQKGEPISRPKEVFRFSISEKSKSVVQEQVQKDYRSIICATKRADYAYILEKFDELKYLYDLLQLEFIKRTYEEASRHVSEHLTEQYRTATASLTRSLINQTIVSADDIQQYQRSIQHAQEADQLRTNHLSKDVVHSSAYVQCLKDLVNRICKDLEGQKFDDRLVKINLDKLKAVIQVFPDYDEIYRDTVQGFDNQIVTLIDSFRESVRTHQFEQSAQNMRSLQEATAILEGHLPREELQKKYEEQKDFFINYLHESLNQFSTFFSRKLENCDIEKLNQCMCMLESVERTYALHSHIPRETVHSIEKNLSEQILRYFNTLVDQIRELIQNHRELSIIEPLMDQLTEIRKISGIDVKTTPSYSSILETLIDYIREARRNVERFVSDLFRQESVNFKGFVSALDALEGGKWIEKYREGVYSNLLRKMEEEIIEELEMLKTSVTQLSLNLDKMDKIESTYKSVNRVAQMKQLKKFFSNIIEEISKVEELFFSLTNGVFKTLTDEFNTQTCQDQGYPSVNFRKAEKGLHYLSLCQELPLLVANTSVVSTADSLETFIIAFSRRVKDELQKTFEKIKEYQMQSKDDIFESARLFQNRLQEVSEIERKYPRVFSHFADQTLVEGWRNTLCTYHSELQDQLRLFSQAKRAEDMKCKLKVAKAFSTIDRFIEGNKYIDLYNQYQQAFFTNTDEIYLKAMEATNQNNYPFLASEMIALQSAGVVGEHLFEQAKRTINFGINNLIEETKSKTNLLKREIDTSEIVPIVTNLKKLQQAVQFISNFLDEHQVQEVNNCIEHVKNLIADRMKELITEVEGLISVNNFSEVDRRIETITLVRNSLDRFCVPDVAEQVSKLKDRQSDLILNDLVKKYREMSLSNYHLDPPRDIFSKLGELRNRNPFYDRAFASITEAIFNNFRQELNKVKSLGLLPSDNKHFRELESAMKYLPQEMQDSLEKELNYCKEDINSAHQGYENELQTALKSSDLPSIKTLMEIYKNRSSTTSYYNKARAHIISDVRNFISQIQECIKKEDISGALEQVGTLFEYRSKFSDSMPEVEKPYLKGRSHVEIKFEENYSPFLETFVEDKPFITSSTGVEAAQKSFILLFAFFEFSTKNRGSASVQDILPNRYQEKIDILHQKMTHLFKGWEKQYQKALHDLDISALNHILERAQLWNPLITRIRDSYSTYRISHNSSNTAIPEVFQLTLFSDMVIYVSQKIKELEDELLGQEIINDGTSSESGRDKFYRSLNEKYQIFEQSKTLSKYKLHLDVEKAQRECLTSLKNKIQAVYVNAGRVLDKVMQEEDRPNPSDCDRFNLNYNTLKSFAKEMKTIKAEDKPSTQSFEETFQQNLRKWTAKIKDENHPPTLAKYLITMKFISERLPAFKQMMNKEIDTKLNKIKSSTSDAALFRQLAVLLTDDNDGIGQTIIAEHKAFQGYALSLFNEKIRKHDIHYVMKNLEGTLVDKKKLKDRYDEFEKKYDQLIQEYLKPTLKLNSLIDNAKTLIRHVIQEPSKIQWSPSIRDKIPALAAHIFALWTLQEAEHYFEATTDGKKDNYLRKPHAAQIVSIFRMLGVGDKEEELKNNLVQIGTGEGKSVTLAATASILALLGFDVYCACYSEYLSQRDYRSFEPLFDTLGVLEHIHYGTFNRLCEHIINEDGDIRQVVEQLISKDSNLAVEKAKAMKRAKILLIDEVDVFFSRDFYGNVYTPAASLRDPTITALINSIWSQRQTKLTLKRVQQTQEYRNCCARFPKWEALIQEAVKDLLADVISFESHTYVVKDDKIGYIEQDNIIFNVIYGYKTLFAYYLEHENGKISPQRLEEKICININCGGFSYAETPLQFQFIIGVTGTLETLSEPEKKVIRQVYGIHKETFTPSVFGKNQLKFTPKDDIRIENSDDYFNTIAREIDDRLQGKTAGVRRAILVFFESETKLDEFYRSEALKPWKESIIVLTEDASSAEKEMIVKRATGSGQVTLFTKTYGRGTDFICHDPNVAANGGIHVIQTFLSEEVSEEVQIKGRTARQGDQGSYSMILLDKDLEKYRILREDIDNVINGKPVPKWNVSGNTNASEAGGKCESVYDLLNNRRIVFFKTQYEANMEYVKAAKKRHDQGQIFLKSLKSGNTEAVKKFLTGENKGAAQALHSRTICLMDATGSMSHLLQKSKNTVGVMFERAAEVLEQNNISADSFQIQFVVYRNYCCREDKILQYSPWETKPDNLRAFMNTINVEGGLGNEAIEIGLWHANRENEAHGITQVILIGDAPPNTRNEIQKKRQRLGEAYWQTTKFAQSTYYEDEMKKLKSKIIPVHAFYVHDRARPSFQTIANETGGRCEFLDINSSSGSEMLTNLVTEEILRNVGGDSKGKELVDAYRAKYLRAYATA